ncbi:flippase [Methylomagnum sp.]
MSVKRHTIFNIAGNLIPAAISLATVPLYLQLVGSARYGAWVIIWTFLSYFAVFDLGLPRAVANRIAPLQESAVQERQTVFWTAFWLSMAFAVAGVGILYGSAYMLLDYVFTVGEALTVEMADALPWMAAWVPVNALGTVAVGALEGRERFGTTNLLQLVGFAVFQVSPLVAVWYWGPSLAVMVAAAIAARGAYASAQLIAAILHLRIRTIRGVARHEVRPLLGYGAWSAVTGLANPIMESVDRLLIGVALGAQSVTFYSVPFGLTDKVRILPDALQRSLFPRLSKLVDAGQARDQAERAVLQLIAMMTALLAPAMFALGPFLTLWVGQDVAERATPLGQIFLVGMWLNGPVFMARVLLQSRGRPDLVAKFQMAEFLPYIAVLWLCLAAWGLTGAALAWALRGLVDTGLMLWMAGLLRRSLVRSLPCAVLVGAACYIAYMQHPVLVDAVIYALGFGGGGLLLAYLTSPDLFRRVQRRPSIAP